MNWPAVGAILSSLSLLVAAGVLSWFVRARQALHYAELDKRYATVASVTEALANMRREVTGARQAVRKDMADLERRIERSDAKADLAVSNADTALHEAQETRTLLEHYHDRIMDDFAKPMGRLSEVLDELSQNVAAQGATLNILLTDRKDKT